MAFWVVARPLLSAVEPIGEVEVFNLIRERIGEFGIVRRDYGEKNIDVLQKYRASWFEAVRWIGANQGEARAIMQKYAGVPPEVARSIVLPNWSEDIKTTQRATEQVMDGMLAGGMISKKANLDQIIIDDLNVMQRR